MATPAFRFSGHETFPCRYAWLPKAFNAITKNPALLADDEEAMVELGLGKNMVRAVRFWVQVSGVATLAKKADYQVTEFGRSLLGRRGFDPFLEDIRTLWLIHWQLSTQVDEPLFAWDFLLNSWHHPEIRRSEVLDAFRAEARRIERDLSDVTLEQHFDTFLHTYVPTRSRKGDIQEDNLDCPLVELELVERVGERRVDGSGRLEPVYAFRREEKPEITPELFIYCLDDFWKKKRSSERTLTFRDVAVSAGSPGQIFKLPEADLRRRLEAIESDSAGAFAYRESSSIQQLSRTRESSSQTLLSSVYGKENA